LSKGLFKKVVCRLHVTSFRIDKSSLHVSFDSIWVFLEAVVQLTECSGSVVVQPTGLSEKDLGFCKSLALFVNIFKKFDGLAQVVGGSSSRDAGFDATVDEVLLCQLHQEISVQSDVEVKIVIRLFGLLNMKTQTLVQKSDCSVLVSLLAPFNDRL
jgi:hypothetical protein